MGLVADVFALLFGGGRNLVRDTAEFFVEHAEAGAIRSHKVQGQSMRQFAGEFVLPRAGAFDRFMDGLNRLPRPALALSTLGLFVTAMVDPLWFVTRMQGIALVPEPLWWLLGVIVSFYFGARHQRKSQDFQRDIVASMARAPQAMANIAALGDLRSDDPGAVGSGSDAPLGVAAMHPEYNPALEDWKARRGG